MYSGYGRVAKRIEAAQADALLRIDGQDHFLHAYANLHTRADLQVSKGKCLEGEAAGVRRKGAGLRNWKPEKLKSCGLMAPPSASQDFRFPVFLPRPRRSASGWSPGALPHSRPGGGTAGHTAQ